MKKKTVRQPQINVAVDQEFYDEFDQWITKNSFVKGQYVKTGVWAIMHMDPDTLSLCVNAMSSKKKFVGKQFKITLEDYHPDKTGESYRGARRTLRDAVKQRRLQGLIGRRKAGL